LLLSAGACSTASAAVDRYLSADAGGAEQQTRRASLLLSIDETDRQTDVNRAVRATSTMARGISWLGEAGCATGCHRIVGQSGRRCRD